MIPDLFVEKFRFHFFANPSGHPLEFYVSRPAEECAGCI